VTYFSGSILEAAGFIRIKNQDVVRIPEIPNF
jgi:hypothetical protein